ncbi:glucan biosynthesis protein [Sphingobium cloacae]|uniref:Periplasmic glucan biosynthesis protein MdoG n=1 Tax=Sphingobium cloacae TaxID=120107 RepID=A0A1E1F2H8_9SPHN|nr:glucan biosynthesis protein [Sphingobium cloacae]BAV64662.1 periplasmic glucan biosynthesis protein MdoG [Sphingobium cloacae]
MTMIDRRAMIAASSAALLLPRPLFAQGRNDAFSWDMLVAMAQRLARAPYKETPLHPGAAKVDYDALHQARFREERTLWGDLPGHTGIRFFPLSANAAQPVAITIVENGRARPLAYDPAMFETPPGNAVAALGPDAGFAGFRIMNAARDGDWLSFLGASYFRAPGPQKQFGLSARAVAINTSIAGKEEFPRFTRFWLERTGPDSVTVHALLDGASITGAFRFVNRYTPQGVRQDVSAALFPRRPIEELGLMPMTSMFWYDQANRIQGTDWRPEIHDSDMLAIASADGTAHGRPLVNPSAPRVDVFEESNPAGFGLLQRDRDFSHYQDDGVFYDRRPSLWAAPSKKLGAGEVRLYAFPTDSEYTDNIAAYWTPSAAVRPGRRIDASYRLDWSAAQRPASSTAAWVTDVWRGRGDQPGHDRLVIDFAGVKEAKPEIWADAAHGTLLKKAGYPVLGQRDLFRVVLDVARQGGGATDIRVQLRSGNRAISEYVHYPLGA